MLEEKIKEVAQQAKDYVLGVNDKIDGKVDDVIDKAQASRFSWMWFFAGAVFALFVIGLLAVN